MKDFVLKGGCTLGFHQDLLKLDWKYQKQDGKAYFHIVNKPPKSVAGWMTLSTNPYLDLYFLKFMHMEQAGVMDKLYKQYLPFKSVKIDMLEPLKVEHFYITLLGICGGTAFSLMCFLVERFNK